MITCHRVTYDSVTISANESGRTLMWSLWDVYKDKPFDSTFYFYGWTGTPTEITNLLPNTIYGFWLKPDDPDEKIKPLISVTLNNPWK